MSTSRCLNCMQLCGRVFCSLDCAEERYSLALASLDAVDELITLASSLAIRRAARASAPAAAAAVERPKAVRRDVAEAPEEAKPGLFAALNGPDAPVATLENAATPAGFDAEM